MTEFFEAGSTARSWEEIRRFSAKLPEWQEGTVNRMGYRNKAFVSFDGDNDIHYYRLMCAWKQNDDIPFNFYDAHDLTQSRDSSLESTIKRSLRERLNNSKVFVLLIGEHTRYLYRFVRWEIEQAIGLDLPIVGVNLNGMRQMDPDRCPPLLRDSLAVHVSFGARILQYALENWLQSHRGLRSQEKSGPYYYKPEVYGQLVDRFLNGFLIHDR